MRYAHRRGDDGDLRSRLREIALERRRFGYRRLGIMLAREGIVMNHTAPPSDGTVFSADEARPNFQFLGGRSARTKRVAKLYAATA